MRFELFGLFSYIILSSDKGVNINITHCEQVSTAVCHNVFKVSSSPKILYCVISSQCKLATVFWKQLLYESLYI